MIKFLRNNWIEIVRIIVVASIIGLLVACGVRGCAMLNAVRERRAAKACIPKVIKVPCGQKVVSASSADHRGLDPITWSTRPMGEHEQPIVVTVRLEGYPGATEIHESRCAK